MYFDPTNPTRPGWRVVETTSPGTQRAREMLHAFLHSYLIGASVGGYKYIKDVLVWVLGWLGLDWMLFDILNKLQVKKITTELLNEIIWDIVDHAFPRTFVEVAPLPRHAQGLPATPPAPGEPTTASPVREWPRHAKPPEVTPTGDPAGGQPGGALAPTPGPASGPSGPPVVIPGLEPGRAFVVPGRRAGATVTGYGATGHVVPIEPEGPVIHEPGELLPGGLQPGDEGFPY